MSLPWTKKAISVLKMSDEEFSICLQNSLLHEDWANRGYFPIWLTVRKIGRDITKDEAELEPEARYYSGGEYKGKNYPRGIVITYENILPSFDLTHEIAHAILGHTSGIPFDRWFEEEIDASIWAYRKHYNIKEFRGEVCGLRKMIKIKKTLKWFDNMVARKAEEVL